MALVDTVQLRVAEFSINKSKLFIYLIFLSIFVTLNYIALVTSVCAKQKIYTPTETLVRDTDNDFNNKKISINEKRCETIHIGVVCIGTTNNLFFYTLLKSLYFYRTNPLHFHVLVDNISNVSIHTLFDTWSVAYVNISVYNVNKYVSKVSWLQTHHYSGVYGLSKLLFPEILPEFVIKIIILDTDLIFNANVFELWLLFSSFNDNQFIGLVENESDFYVKQSLHWPAIGRGYNTGIVLCDLQKMKRFNWNDIWFRIANNTTYVYGSTSLADQDVINAVIKQHPAILFQIPCNWNVQLSDHTFSYQCYSNNSIKVIHWNSPRKLNTMNKDGNYFKNTYTIFSEMNGNLLKSILNTCVFTNKQGVVQTSKNPCDKFQQRSLNKWRTLLFFRNYEYTYANNDVTFVTQFSYDRLHMLVELFITWKGPMTLTLYATDLEFQQVISFLNNISILKMRTNIAFHVVFKDGDYYPINFLRNVGLLHVSTPYVFLVDIDFIPSFNLYSTLKQYVAKQQNMYKKALIVPAFESQGYKNMIPKNKKELLMLLEKNKLFTFRFDVWAAGHAPTNYTKWKTAEMPYEVKWKPDFEPYVVVTSNVTKYDTRFIGFGWNKVSHTMELKAQGYEFIVLPHVFIIHKAHAPSNDILKFRRSSIYRMCLQKLKEEFVAMLRKKYTKFSNEIEEINIIR